MSGTQYDDVSTSNIVLVGIISALCTVIIILALDVLYHESEQEQYVLKTIDQTNIATQDYKNAQLSRLVNYGWVNKQEGIVEVPVSQAMQAVVAEQAKLQHESSTATESEAGKTDKAS